METGPQGSLPDQGQARLAKPVRADISSQVPGGRRVLALPWLQEGMVLEPFWRPRAQRRSTCRTSLSPT